MTNKFETFLEKDDLKPLKNNRSDCVISTVSPIPSPIDEQIPYENCTYVTIKDSGLMGSIARYVGGRSNRSFVVTPKSTADTDSDTFRWIVLGDDQDKKLNIGNTEERTELSMGLGWHEVEFENTKIKLLLHSIGRPVGTSNCPKFFERLVIFVEGVGKQALLQKFCDFVIEWDEETQDKTFNIYQYNVEYSYWYKTSTKLARPIDSVILPPGVKDALIHDLDDFVLPETFRWYKAHGIPYKRSYLLYGPPGSGKSSIVQVIAGKYKRNLCFVQPLHPKFTDDTFSSCIQSAPRNALIVMEDIDSYFGKDRGTLHHDCPLTFSGLLNGLDGVGSADGQIFILTTNFLERLDDALIRSGRVDKKLEFPTVSPDMAQLMFLQFYPGEEKPALLFKEQLHNLVTKLENNKLCMADLQQHFIANRKNDAKTAAEDIKDITGEQFKLLNEIANKKEDKHSDDDDDTDSSSSFLTLGKTVSLVIGVGLSVGLGVGIAFIGAMFLYKKMKF